MQQKASQRTVEVCFSPKLFSEILTREPLTVVLVDILRATTSIVTAFENGVRSILPVATLDEARAWKAKGYPVASEQDGKKLDFADFGNSAFSFTRERVEGKTLVYCTTNGTRALEVARPAGEVVIGAFLNLEATADWLKSHDRNAVILCSGWKNKFCLEDALFAGALTEMLTGAKGYRTSDDAACASLDLWKIAQADLPGYLEKAAHRRRLRRLGLDDVLEYSFSRNVSRKVPVFNGKEIT
ncbi:MAG TPA: 2-phosphosulfolactate phosphatase [Bacteroidales bacterium]|nr:2-phosphosulfolactate phosphatase [Bacteroidales bacterium]